LTYSPLRSNLPVDTVGRILDSGERRHRKRGSK
jgi:hypothetical protein